MTDFGIKLLQWYHVYKRSLPWRSVNDPYKVWLSEIILQQTQVVQGLAYYERFVQEFPDVHSLAMASEEKVLKLWQGLGYYSRARNLHTTARFISTELKGIFPSTYNDILKLKGIGPYTAAAISSFCFGEPRAAIDGNVYRFISRLKGIHTPIDTTEGKKEFALMAEVLLNKKEPGDHNQAMIEYGALVCKPANPVCNECIFNDDCIAFSQRTVSELPAKSKKLKQRQRYFNYFLIENEGAIYLEKRSGNDIWKNLYQLPLTETEHEVTPEELSGELGTEVVLIAQKKHILSHQVINASFYFADKSVVNGLDGGYVLVNLNEIKNYPFSQLVANFLDERIRVRQD